MQSYDIMTKFTWNQNLQSTMQRIAAVATGPTQLAVITAAKRVALALPSNQAAAQLVLDLYQPRRLAGKCFKRAAGALNMIDFRPLSHLYSPSGKSIPAVEWLRDAAECGTIGFLGCNPAHGLRCIATGILPDTGESFIAKLGFDESAEAVKREHDTINKIRRQHIGIVDPVERNKGDDWYMMRLPHLGNKTLTSISTKGVVELLNEWLHDHETKLSDNSWANSLIERACVHRALRGWHGHMQQLTIRSSLMHGDFAIWNLRKTPTGVQAMDWEWAEPEGIAGIDLVHGLRQEAHLIRKLSAPASISWMKEQATQAPWAAYLKEAGWAGELDNWLRLGLLHSHYNAKNESRNLLREMGIYVD